MQRYLRQNYEQVLAALALVLFVVFAIIIAWDVSTLVSHLNTALQPATPSSNNAVFNLDKAEGLQLQLTP